MQQPEDWDAILAHVDRNIKEQGWHMTVIKPEGDIPAIVYTIGLYYSFQQPELIMVGLPFEMMLQVLGEMSSAIKRGVRFKDRDTSSDFLMNDIPVEFVEIESEEEKDKYMTIGQAFYTEFLKTATTIPVLQVLWPDENGFLPYERDCSYSVKYRQPILADIEIKNRWPFYEQPQTRCIISHGIVSENKKILIISRSPEGVLRFLEGPNPEKTWFVSLEEIYKFDKSIESAVDLDNSEMLQRTSENGEWFLVA